MKDPKNHSRSILKSSSAPFRRWIAAAVVVFALIAVFRHFSSSSRAANEVQDFTVGVRSDQNGIYVTIQAVRLENGTIPIPPQFSKVILEVGSNSRSYLGAVLGDDAFLITFEPLLDKFARLLTHYGGKADTFAPLGYQHAHGIIFPVAISHTEGMLEFNVAPKDGCSSLLKMKDNSGSSQDNGWPDWVATECTKQAETRRVPSVSLETVIAKWLDGRSVDFLKVDAQGFDLAVFESSGSRMHSIHTVMLETVADRCPPLYDQQPRCSTMTARMSELGYELVNCSKFSAGCVPLPTLDCNFPTDEFCERDLIWRLKADRGNTE